MRDAEVSQFLSNLLLHNHKEKPIMKSLLLLFVSMLTLNVSVLSQDTFKKVNVGHTFSLSLPNYFTKTTGLNSVASIQFKSEVRDVYGFIIVDTKEELQLADIVFTSIQEYHNSFIESFLTDQKNRDVGTPKKSNVGSFKYLENEISYFDENAQTDITYYVGLVETGRAYYKLLCWTTKEKKDLFKKDYNTMLTSIKD